MCNFLLGLLVLALPYSGLTHTHKRKEAETHSFKCNVKYIHVHLLSTSAPAGHDAGRLLCSQLASLFIYATSETYCLPWWHQRLGLINGAPMSFVIRDIEHANLGGTCRYPCPVTGMPCYDKATQLQAIKSLFALYLTPSLEEGSQRERVATRVQMSRMRLQNPV